MKIGVLALQGDFREHIRILRKLDADAVEVRMPKDLNGIDGLIIPGGESTSIGILMKRAGMDREIKNKHNDGMPIYGTCAGAILLAKEIIGNRQLTLGLIDISVKRNDYGRQIDSFEADLSIKDVGDFKGIFIRAPRIARFNNHCQILSELNLEPIMLRENNVLITTFHPELTGDARVHKYFLDMAQEHKELKDAPEDAANQNSREALLEL